MPREPLDMEIQPDDDLEIHMAKDPDNYDGVNDYDRKSWSIDNRGTRVFTLRPNGIPGIEIEIRYTLDEYWAGDSDYYKAWDAYYIEKLPKALSDAVFAFIAEAGTYVNRTLGYAMGQNGPGRVDPCSPTKEDIKWVNDFHRECLEERMNVRKKSGRGGRRRLDWPDERKINFLGVYETMKSHVKDAASRVRLKDPFQLRISVLQASNSVLPKAQRLPASTLRSLAERADQIAVDRRSAPSLAMLTMEAAAEKFGVEINEYLSKVLTAARKIRTEKSQAQRIASSK